MESRNWFVIQESRTLNSYFLLIFNMYIKRISVTGIFKHWSISISNLLIESLSQSLSLLSGNLSWNLGPVHQDAMQCLKEWNIFKNKGPHFIHLKINTLLSKIEELHRMNTLKKQLSVILPKWENHFFLNLKFEHL